MQVAGRRHYWITNSTFLKILGAAEICLDCGQPRPLADAACRGFWEDRKPAPLPKREEARR